MTYISAEGLAKLKEELKHRTGMLRSEIAQRIKEAKAMGDLSENFEYQEALEAQSFNEGRIGELGEIVRNAIVMEKKKSKGGVINIGSTIVVESSELGRRELTIVGSAEADPVRGRISNESPLGLAFLGKKKGDEPEVETPSGLMKYKILDVK